MSKPVAPAAKLIAIKLVRTAVGVLVQWHLYDEGRGRGSIVYVSADGSPSPAGVWGDRLSVLREATVCEGAIEVTAWIEVAESKAVAA